MRRLALALLLAGCGSAPEPGPWAGVNYPDLWAEEPEQVRRSLDLMSRGNLSVVRIFVTATRGVGDVEDPVGAWNDEILDRIDALFAACRSSGIRVIVVLHDHWALGRWQTDAYARKWKEPLLWPVGKTGPNDPGGFFATTFYRDEGARAAFRNRIRHILEYRGRHTGSAWKDLNDVVLAWEPQNEPNWRARKTWTEETARWIKEIAPDARVFAGGVTVALRGGEDLVRSSPSVDGWGYHWYGVESLQQVADLFDRLGCRWFFEEFGGPRGDPKTRARYESVLKVAGERRVPWMFWRLGPNRDAGSFDLWEGDPLMEERILPTSRRP